MSFQRINAQKLKLNFTVGLLVGLLALDPLASIEMIRTGTLNFIQLQKL